MLYKNKGSINDCSEYRAIGLLNHVYKILSTVLLQRILNDCGGFLSEWQAGFRSQRGCRDNILLLRVLYDQIINNNSSCVVTYIDYSASFDSISYKFMDKTLANAKASAKTRAIFRAIYQAASGIARVRGTDKTHFFSRKFNIGRGVIQGDIVSPVLFILALDQIMQLYDKDAKGVRCGRILRIKVLGYADDAALADYTVDSMTKRLTKIAGGSKNDADMDINMSKTFSQHVHRREKIVSTQTEAKKAEAGYKFVCDFCPRRFKTSRNMQIHRAAGIHNYATTDEIFELESIEAVFGHKESRWFLVKYRGYEEPEWSREHLLLRDGCNDIIRDFWSTSGLNPNKQFYADNSANRCPICAKTYKRPQDLKAHQTRTGHKHAKTYKVTDTAFVDAVVNKRQKSHAKQLPESRMG